MGSQFQQKVQRRMNAKGFAFPFVTKYENGIVV